MHHIFSLAFILATVAPSNAGDNWPQFRGPTGDGHSTARGLPTDWSESTSIRWKTAIHDKGWSSPVIWGDQIWLTTASEDGTEMFVVCVDRRSGNIIHDLKVFTIKKPDPLNNPVNSYASPTPVVEQGRVYVHFGRYGTACLDTATAKVLWERHDLPCDHWRGPGSSPILHDDLLILTFDGHDVQYLAGLDKNTGRTVWKKDRDIKYTSQDGDLHKAYSTPSIFEVDGKKQLVSPSAHATIGYDPMTGEELWRINHGGMNAASKPVFGHGLIFLTTGHNTHLLAVKQGGKGELTQDSVAWTTNRGVPSRPSLLLKGDYLYLVSDQGFISCVEAKTGKQLWQERLGGPCSSSPIFADGHIYIADEKGTTHVIEPGTEFKKTSANVLGSGCMASPAAVGDAIYLRTRTHLYCIGK